MSGLTQDATRRIFCLVIAFVIGLIGIIAGAPQASALSGYTVVGKPGLNARTGPGTSHAIAGSITYGAGLEIACQVTNGTNVGGSTVWDRLNAPYAGRWVADFWVGGTPYGRRDPRLPDCNAPVATYSSMTVPVGPSLPAPAATALREQRALEWAAAQLGSTAYSGWCDRFVAHAYGRTASGYQTAAIHYRDLAARGLVIHDLAPPAGALVFYGPQPGFGDAGHVTISRGGGQFISPSATIFAYTGIETFPNYLGWAYANPEWPGR